MEIIYECCCGIDVHKKMLVACLRVGKQNELRTFETTTNKLRELADWLLKNNCQMVAMESTGSFWKPIYNVLEIFEIPVMVVNAHHIKTVPGRKTDIKDAQWIADLLRHGLLKSSYSPDKSQRELREVTRYRKSLTEERAKELNRLQKMLEGANIKLSSFVTDIGGMTGRTLINGVISDSINPESIDGMLFGKLKSKKEELLISMDGVLSEIQKLLIKNVLDHIDDMSMRISAIDELIDNQMEAYANAISALDEIQGIGRQSAQTILAEIGLDMSRFPSDAHISSWAGLSPGNNESAGKRKSGKTTKGNKTLKTTLTQCAKSAVKNKSTFFKAQYDKLVVRRGAKCATVAVAHTMLIAIYHMLKNNTAFNDLGPDYYSKFNTDKKIKAYLKKLQELGWQHPTLAVS